jgi:hypothetical protein
MASSMKSMVWTHASPGFSSRQLVYFQFVDGRQGRASRPADTTSQSELRLYLIALVQLIVGVRAIRRSGMKALVYHGPGQKAWEDAPKPA